VANEDEAERTVRACLAALEAHDRARTGTFLTDDVVYHNIPMDPVVGLEATLTFLDGFFSMFTGTVVDILHLAVRDAIVLTERIDTLTIDGRVAPLPVMGAFELRDGKICAWRDYFDLAQITAMLGQSAHDANPDR
jgi:limonene-1,2-epoxide hydrolase